jgi:hypothetical protein
LLNIAYAMEEKINFKNTIKEWWLKWTTIKANI